MIHDTNKILTPMNKRTGDAPSYYGTPPRKDDAQPEYQLAQPGRNLDPNRGDEDE